VRLLNLPAQLHRWGLTVVEVDGWQSRGADFPSTPHVVVWHHTGTPQHVAGDYPTQNVVVHGRSDLPGPLCQVGLGRSGTVYVIAAGKANHAGKGHWQGRTVGNSDSVGIEAESPGDGHWTPEQRRVYPVLAAALHDLLQTPAALSCAHRESAEPHGRKDDPVGIDMPAMRAAVAQLLHDGPGHKQVQAQTAHAPAPVVTHPPEDQPVFIVKDPKSDAQYVVRADLSLKTHIVDPATLKALQATGEYKALSLTGKQLAAIPGGQ
jgi:hypothetical protein